MTIRVVIVDDHVLFAEAIRPVLSSNGMDVLEVVTTAGGAMEAVTREGPDLVLMDLVLPDESGVEVGRRILERCPGTRVVAVTALSDARLLQEAIKAGFHGYVTKDTPVSRFVDSIRAAMSGDIVVPHRLAARAAGARSRNESDASLLAEQLTPRERDVLALLVEGAQSEDIAAVLSISPNTVRTHIQNILTKLQVHSRLEAAAFAVRCGLVTLQRNRRPTQATPVAP